MEKNQTKLKLRQKLLDRRDLVSLALAEEKALAMREQLLKLPLHGIIAGYHATRREADPAPFLESLHEKGHTLALPVIRAGNHILFCQWKPGDTLHVNRYGIHEPPETASAIKPDAILVPLIAFDLKGHRLGYGGGFYDRTLAMPDYDRCRRIGLAYDFQKVERLPSEPHDVTLDFVVTETTTYRFDG